MSVNNTFLILCNECESGHALSGMSVNNMMNDFTVILMHERVRNAHEKTSVSKQYNYISNE